MERRQRSKRHAILSESRVLHITKLISGLPSQTSPTWERIVKEVESQTGCLWSRQALEAHVKIKLAYKNKKQEFRALSSTGMSPRTRLPEKMILEQKYQSLRDENSELRNTLLDYDVRLITYTQNAINHGITQEQLERPLVPPHRGQTD